MLLVASGLALACAAELTPAPEARRNAGDGAVDSHAGVIVEARADAWDWNPPQLERELTPMLVSIANESTRPLRVRYGDFALVDGAGARLSALPPSDIELDVTLAVPAYGYASGLFSRRYDYGGAYAHDPLDHGTHHTHFVDVQLPTRDMLSQALPEGVVSPGGRVSGFLYFERVEDPAHDRVDFRFALVDASTAQGFGDVAIPFRLESGS
jgi:hypothetical protein